LMKMVMMMVGSPAVCRPGAAAILRSRVLIRRLLF
jgi:hypothetical protein